MSFYHGVGIVCAIICLELLRVEGSHLAGQSCPDQISIVTSQCLAQYVTKVHHMQRHQQNFYTGIDIEEMRSICQSMQKAVHCVTATQGSCPHLEEAVPSYPSDFIAVYHLCHANNFYEVYAINQFCYARVSSSTNRCYDRFSSRTLGQIPDPDYPMTVRNYCSHLKELTGCVWAIVTSQCGAPAADLTEALVRPAVPHSDSCLQDGDTTTRQSTVMPSTSTQKLYKYREGNDKDSVSNQQRNDDQLENHSNSVTQNRWIYLTISLTALVNYFVLR